MVSVNSLFFLSASMLVMVLFKKSDDTLLEMINNNNDKGIQATIQPIQQTNMSNVIKNICVLPHCGLILIFLLALPPAFIS